MAAEIHVGDTGTSFVVTLKDEDGVAVDLTSVDIIQVEFVFKKPDQTTITKIASFVTDGIDGKAKYVTTSSDLDDVGRWSLQAYVKTVDGYWHSDITKFKVEANLK